MSLLRLCVLLSGDRQVAEDIVHEAFVKVAQRIQEVPPERAGAYLRREVVNLWRNSVRGLIRERRARDRAAPASPGGALAYEDVEALRSAVSRFPRKQRVCIVLRYYEDPSDREVASLLGCSVGTVQSQASKALARLSEGLGDDA